MTQRPFDTSQPPRDPPNIARDGAAKHAVDKIPTTPRMRRVTTGEPAAFHHGVTVDDTPNSKIIQSHEKPVGFHTSVSDDQIIKFSRNPTSEQVLSDASRLGKPKA